MERLTVGMHVDIKRSDGRIHSAMVTEIRRETNLVNVEWFEKGETKGKEIDFSALLRTNPTLAGSLESPLKPVAPLEDSRKENQKRTLNVPHAAQPKSNGASIPEKKADRRTVFISKTNSENNEMPPPKPGPTQAQTKMPPISKSRIVEEVSSEDMSSPIIPKSTVVNEIDKIRRDREERRAQQNEEKKRREQLKSLDPGNPNWQFLSMIREYQAQIDYRPLKMSDPVNENRICVCVRKRPLSKIENGRKEIDVITIPNKDHLIVHQPQVKVDLTKYLENIKFRFDYTFDENSSNEMVYKFTAQPLVKTIFQQGFATCFAYGQTGSGKTHTMGGDFNGKVQDCTRGIYAMTARDVFSMLKQPEYRNENLQVGCSFFEIYGGKVFDLLSKRAKLRILEDGKKSVQVVGLKEVTVASADEIIGIIKTGSELRTAGTTSANNNSSRSHAVFQIILRKKSHQTQVYGKFSLIDLAGNERGADTISSDRQTRMEGAEINKALLSLKECIRAMGRNSNYVPFRMSKLTLVLRDSFIGQNAKTCMIAMVSPGMNSVENTLNTLRYADRVKELGCEEGASSPLSDEQLMTSEGDELFVDDDDLSILRSRNTDLANDDEYKRYVKNQCIHDVMKAEERAIDDQQSLVELMRSIESINQQTSGPDYNMDAYVYESMQNYERLESLLRQCKDSMKKFNDKLRNIDT